MKIPGYLTLEKLSQGKSFAVYRAKKEKDNSPSILKTLDKKTARNLNDINALRHEYHLLKAIDSDYVIKAVTRSRRHCSNANTHRNKSNFF